MNSSEFQSLDDAFNRAIELGVEQRALFLAEIGKENPPWLARLLAMLSAAESDNDPLLDSVQCATRDYSASIPEWIGPFKVLKELGVGGMGAVYLCQRSGGDFVQQVVVKRPGHAGTDTQLVRERLALERRLLASLHHPNIAQFIDGGDEHGVPYVAMEYVDGTDIVDYAEQKQLARSERIQLFLSLCSAVQFAHRNSVVHRDIKPDNVLIDLHGQVKLLDFGIAKLIGDDERHNESSRITVAGAMTPNYASPEQITGEIVSQASDIYSLGMILYELLVGEPAYRLGSTRPSDIERVVCYQAPVAPSKLNQDRNAGARDLDAIVLKALHKEPERRYASAKELADDLQRWLDSRPVLARADSSWYRLRTFARRHPFGVTTAVLGFTMLVMFSGAMAWQSRQLAEQRDMAAYEAQVANESADFLIQLFLDSNPLQQNPAEITAVDLLNTAAEKLPYSLENDLLTRVQLMQQVALAFLVLGENDQSIEILGQALAIAEEVTGPESAETAEATHLLGDALRRNNQLDQAESLLAGVLSWRIENSADTADIADSYNSLGIVQRQLRKFSDAEEMLRMSVQLYGEVGGENSSDLAMPYNNLASVLLDLDRLEEAHDAAKRSVHIHEANNLPLAGLARAKNVLAKIELYMGLLDDAVKNSSESLAAYRQVYGDHHQLVSSRTVDLALIHVRRGEIDIADQLFREAMQGLTSIDNIDSESGAKVQLNYGRFLLWQGDVEQAKSLIEDAYRVAQQLHHPDSIEMRRYERSIEALQNALRADQGLN